MNFSEALDEHGQSVKNWLDAAKKQVAAVDKLQKAIAAGNVRDLEKLRQNAQSTGNTCAAKAGECQPFNFDIKEYLQREDGYLAELKDAAQQAEVQMFERDGVIFCYPVLVRLEPELTAARIDKKLEPSLRPDTLTAILKKAQSREPKSQPERFIETLFQAYRLISAGNGREGSADIALIKIYEMLTLLPGANRDYTLLDFTRDLYFLDISGIAETKNGFRLSLPASTVSRERSVKILPFVTRDGHEKGYAAIKFTPAAEKMFLSDERS